MAVFAHEENPLDEREWENLKSVVIDVARRRLVGRRIVDIFGPLGAGVQTIVHDHFTGNTMGSSPFVSDRTGASPGSERTTSP